jgi:hypothetical protein
MMILLPVFGYSHSFAAVSDIDFSKLDGIAQAEELKKNAFELEPLAKEWSSEWKHSVPKEQVIDLAKKTMGIIDDVLKDKPNHAEMLIFKGLMAYYAYNLDLREYNDIAEKSFKAAQALVPEDIRPTWFLGKHFTLSARPALGMQTITPIIKKNKPEQLPSRFWGDYAYCAYLAAMPSSALMGIDYSEKTAGVMSPGAKLIRDTVQSRMIIPSENKEYDYKTIWSFEKTEPNIRFTNRMFGFYFTCPGEWNIGFGNAKNGKCGVRLGLPGKKGAVTPNINIIAETAKENPKLEDFMKKYLPAKIDFQKVSDDLKVPGAVAVEGVVKKYYKKRQSARLLAIVLSRQQPAYPGVALEHPIELPLNKQGEPKPQFFRAREVFARFNHPIYYMIVLDAPESAYPAARKELDMFLSGFFAE